MFRALITLLIIAYPLAVYFGLQWLSVRHLAVLIVSVLLIRLISMRQLQLLKGLQWPVIGGALVVALALVFDSKFVLKLYPVMINAVMLAWFLLSLRNGPPVIERFARLQEPELDESGVRYTRQVTKVWCVFFVGNGAAALFTSVYASDWWWMLYNGLLSYVLMALLFAGEWLVRQYLQRRNRAA